MFHECSSVFVDICPTHRVCDLYFVMSKMNKNVCMFEFWDSFFFFFGSCQFTAVNTWWQSAPLLRHTTAAQNICSCQQGNLQVLLWINHTGIPDERGVTLALIRLIIWSECGVISPREHQMWCVYRAKTNTVSLTFWKHFMLDSTGVWRDGSHPPDMWEFELQGDLFVIYLL